MAGQQQGMDQLMANGWVSDQLIAVERDSERLLGSNQMIVAGGESESLLGSNQLIAVGGDSDHLLLDGSANQLMSQRQGRPCSEI